MKEKKKNLNRIKLTVIVTLYIFFGIIDFATKMWLNFNFQTEGGMYPLLFWNPLRIPLVPIFLLGLIIYSSIKILNLELDKALKFGIVIIGSDALNLLLDTWFIGNFSYISPNIGYYLEIVSLIFFSIFNGALLFCIKYRNILNNKRVLERREKLERKRKKKEIKRENRFQMIDDASKNKISLFGIRLTKRQSTILFYLLLVGTIILLFFIGFAFLIITVPYSLSYEDALLNLLPNNAIFIIFLIICIYSLIKSRRIVKFYSEFESTKNLESNVPLFCSNCGNKMIGTENYCITCGQKLN